MKNILHKSLLFVLLLFFSAKINAQTPFTCSGQAYQVAGSVGGNSVLYGYDVNSGTRTTIASLGFAANAIGYNTLDNLIWGYNQSAERVVAIGSTGASTSYQIPNLPANDYNVGTIIPGGYLFLYVTGSARYYVVDINPARSTYLRLVDPTAGYVLETSDFGTATTAMSVSDLAYQASTGRLLGLGNAGTTATEFRIIELTPTTGGVTVSSTKVTGGGIQAGDFGSVFTDPSPTNLYVFNNQSGKFFEVDIPSRTASVISQSPPASNNDGASCGTLVPTTADLQITKTGTTVVNPNGTVSYTLTVTNNGPGPAGGTTISDPAVPNFTVNSVTCIDETGLAECPNPLTVALLQNGTLTIPSLPNGTSVTLAVVGTAGTNGTIVNVATVAPPSGVTDPTNTNNSSTAITTINAVAVSGSVWHDADGSLSLNGSETGTNAGGPLFVNVVDATNTVVASASVAANGTYSLTGVPANTTGLKLVLANTATATTPGTLPTNWVNTGENVGAGNPATQSATLGQIELTTGTGAITAQSFGIEALPVTGSGTATASNPGGSSPVTVPATAFTSTTPSTDTAPGSVTAIKITTFPTNVTSLTVNGTTYTAGTFPAGGVTVPATSTGAPTVPILVDPTTDSSPVSLSFVAVDNAGKSSTSTGTATLTSALVTTVSGSVWHDADGSLTQNGSETGTNAGGPLFVNVVDATNTVVASASVAANGTYSLTGVPANTTGLKLVLANTATATTPGTLPTNWVNTGESVGSGNTATQSATLGQIELTTTAGAITAQSFGIEALPVTGSGSATASNAGGTSPVTVPSTAFTSTSPSTDTAPGSVTAIKITTFPTNVTSLTINGITYTASSPEFSGPTPAGVTVPATSTGAPTVPILVDPTTDSSPVSLSFVAVDNAGKPSTTTGTATLTSSLLTTVSGSVWHDANGSTTQDGSETGTNAGGGNFVNLLNGNTVLASSPVAPDGTYSLTGVPTNTTGLRLVLTNSASGITPGLLSTLNWVSTGESVGSGNTATQTAQVGQIELNTGTSAITAQDFGVNARPTTSTLTRDVPNINGSAQVPVPVDLFGAADTAPGSVTAIRITNFPVGATTVVIGGTSYTSGSWPGGGVIVPTDGSGQPTTTITVDPTNDNVTSVLFPYVARDNGGTETITPAISTLRLSAATITVSGQVWHDADGSLAQNGGEPGTNAGGPLFVNLVNASNTVVASASVAPDGTYSLTGVPAGVTGLRLVLANTATATTPGTLPTNWVNTGESVGAGNPATQSATLGQIELTTGTGAITAQSFGIEALPVTGSGTATATNPGGSSPVTVPATAFTSTTPSTDTAPGSVTAIRITSFPSNVTSLTINGTTYTAGTFPVGGVTVPANGSGAPTVPILVDPTIDANPVSFTFAAIDNAGKPSTSTGIATVTMGIFSLSPDLSPVIYVRPSTTYNTTPITVVVEVYELNNVATNGLITVKLSKDTKVNLGFTQGATSVGGQTVNNSVWSFDASSDPDYYTLTTSQVITAGNVLSFGLSGALTPGFTSGALTFTSVIGPGSGAEVRITNNTDADKIDFFQQ